MDLKYQYKYLKYKFLYNNAKSTGGNDFTEIPKLPKYHKTKAFKLLDGSPSKSKTHCKLNWDDKYLNITWISFPDIKNINQENKCNKPVTGFTSDMAEIYICPENENCETYLEVEINPMGKLWIAVDYNKGGDRKYGLKRRFIDCDKSGVKSRSILENNKWVSHIRIPWKLLKQVFSIKSFSPTDSKWKINLFCVRSLNNKNHCTGSTGCEYSLLNPTFEFKKPNYHVTKYFFPIKIISS